MKTPTLILIAALALTTGQAAVTWIQNPGELPFAEHLPPVKIPVLTLLDGRTFKDCSVTKETYATISFRHARGMSKVEKRLLPPDVLKIFPLDAEMAKVEAEANAAGLKVYEERKAQVTAQREAEGRARQAKVDAQKARAQAAAEARREQVQRAVETAVTKTEAERAVAAAIGPDFSRLTAAARAKAETYYGDGRRNGSGASLVFNMKFELEDPRPIPGWTGQYEIEGTVHYNFYDSIWGGSFSSADSRFSCTVEQKESGLVKVLSFTRKS